MQKTYEKNLHCELFFNPPPLMFYLEVYEFFKATEAANGGVSQYSLESNFVRDT